MGHWRKILKKLKSILLLALVIILTGCGNSNEAEVNTQEETTTNVEEKENSTETTKTDEVVKIGVIGRSKVWDHVKVKWTRKHGTNLILS